VAGNTGGNSRHYEFFRDFDRAARRAAARPIPSSTATITPEIWANDVMRADSADVWLIEFYSELTEASHMFGNVWEAAATSLNGFVKCARVNHEDYPELTGLSTHVWWPL
jgi:hypothetical protein